ncbi:hypothetical protein [Actinopolymorpha rutila]|uniref:Uncharacterized protein n=1 Tax=Actinopolymorpha rutila TaxID=446787 RepID=A0A852ZFW5_9ACTN|nr:hypothetical protein [Actinopolymorpha rutila]NYH91997.1 hypothetical protein [Actinopolymorpha rutila]
MPEPTEPSEPSEPTEPSDALHEGGAAARRWRARREREHGLDAGDGQERLDGNPYVDGLKYACAGFAGLGLIAFALRPDLGLLLWGLAGLSLVGWLVVGALLWQPPTEQPPPSGQYPPE